MKFCGTYVDVSPSSSVPGVTTDAGRVKVTCVLLAVAVLAGIVDEVPQLSLLMVVHATKIYKYHNLK